MKFEKDGQIITTYDIKTQQELKEQGYREVKEVALPENYQIKKKGV